MLQVVLQTFAIYSDLMRKLSVLMPKNKKPVCVCVAFAHFDIERDTIDGDIPTDYDVSIIIDV